MTWPIALGLTALTIPFIAIFLLHWTLGARRLRLRQEPEGLGLTAEKLHIPLSRRHKLFAWWIPASHSQRTVIILHGWGSSASQLLPLAPPFHRAAFNVLLMDARNHGHSDRHGISSMPAFADDLAHVRRWLSETRPTATHALFLIGHSVGAGAVLLEAARNPVYQGVISLAAFAHPALLMRRYLCRYHLPQWLVSSILTYIQWVIGHDFDSIAPVNTIHKISCPILLVHGKADTTVPYTDAEMIFSACPKNRCELLLVDDATHESIDKIEEHGDKLVRFFMRLSTTH